MCAQRAVLGVLLILRWRALTATASTPTARVPPPYPSLPLPAPPYPSLPLPTPPLPAPRRGCSDWPRRGGSSTTSALRSPPTYAGLPSRPNYSSEGARQSQASPTVLTTSHSRPRPRSPRPPPPRPRPRSPASPSRWTLSLPPTTKATVSVCAACACAACTCTCCHVVYMYMCMCSVCMCSVYGAACVCWLLGARVMTGALLLLASCFACCAHALSTRSLCTFLLCH